MQNAGYVAAVVICGAAATAITVARFWVRNISIKKFTPSEYVIVTSQILLFALIGMNIAILREPVEESVILTKLFFACTLIHFALIWSIKISVNLLYVRLTTNLGTLHKVCIASLVFVCITGVAVMLLEPFTCWPIHRRFSTDAADACDEDTNAIVFWIIFSLNITTDLILFVLPFPLVRNILNPHLQVALALTFAFALLIPVMASISAVLILHNGFSDLTVIVLCSAIECCVGMSISALPGLCSPWLQKIRETGSIGKIASIFRKKEKSGSISEWSNAPSSGTPPSNITAVSNVDTQP